MQNSWRILRQNRERRTQASQSTSFGMSSFLIHSFDHSLVFVADRNSRTFSVSCTLVAVEKLRFWVKRLGYYGLVWHRYGTDQSLFNSPIRYDSSPILLLCWILEIPNSSNCRSCCLILIGSHVMRCGTKKKERLGAVLSYCELNKVIPRSVCCFKTSVWIHDYVVKKVVFLLLLWPFTILANTSLNVK